MRHGCRISESELCMWTGGCGAFEDYTEGPFSRDVLIENNTFDHIAPDTDKARRKIDPTADDGGMCVIADELDVALATIVPGTRARVQVWRVTHCPPSADEQRMSKMK